MKDLLRFNIQLFSENLDPNPQKEIDELGKDLIGDPVPPTPPAPDPNNPNPDPTTADPNNPNPTPPDPNVDPNNPTPPDPNADPEKDPKNPMHKMRQTIKEKEDKLKELEETKEKEKVIRDNLFRASKLGITGETIEEVLEKLEAHDIKSEADKKGLTEEQIKKEKELEEKMKNLNQSQTEMLFNQRAFDLQKNKGLSSEEINKFVVEAAEIGINLLSTGVDFKRIYERLNPSDNTSSIFQEKDAKIAELEAEVQRLKDSTVPGKGVKGTDGKGDGTGNEELDKLLGELI